MKYTAGLLIITGRGFGAGFRMAGFECIEAGMDDDVSGLLLRLQAEGEYGLIAVDERLLVATSEAVMKRIERRSTPVIMPINLPEKWGEEGIAETAAMRLIRRAIGYQIRLKR